MHGRLKIKSTAEQQEAKRKEREKKLKLYKAAIQKIFQKREKSEYDAEALTLSKEFLQENPDFSTLWNFRREVILCMKLTKNEEEIQNLGEDELVLTQTCLMKNPKSYGAWHHRGWTMKFLPKPDWDKELQLCSTFLRMDERNFHCWDYRRFVCMKSHVKPVDELSFTTGLIETNFSNYSAWHYRSTLLPVVHPGTVCSSVKEEILLKEYELVQNAAFTDPNDQSVWFYHRWLLGRGQSPLEIKMVYVSQNSHTVIILLSGSVKVDGQKYCLKLLVNGNPYPSLWKPAGEHSYASSVWQSKLAPDVFVTENNIEITVELTGGSQQSCVSCVVNGVESFVWKISSHAATFQSELSAATKDVLEKELESCKQLYELEPDNKWTLFTSILLMRALDSQKYEETTFQYLDQLVDIDSLRAQYYRDLKSKFVMENAIEVLALENRELDLTNKNLTSLHHGDQLVLMQKVNLSSNQLTSAWPACYLLCVQHLILDDNMLTDCKGLERLQELTHLSLRRNSIKSVEDLEPLLTCSQLQYLFLEGNPLTNESSFAEKIKHLFNIRMLDGLHL